MLNKKELVALGKAIASRDLKNPQDVYEFKGKTCSYEALNQTFKDEMKALAGDYNSFRRNALDVYEIIQEVIDEVLPQKILGAYAEWAEIKQVPNGTKAKYTMKTGKQRAKKFITRVGLAGVYEVFKLDKEFFEVETTAYGGAAQIGIEEMLDNMVDFAELTQIVMEGLDEAILREIAKAFESLETSLPGVNTHTDSAFNEPNFDRLLATTRAYGTPVIYTTQELASKILPAQAMWSEKFKDNYLAQGYAGSYKGTKVVILPQSFEYWDNDADINKYYVFDPQLAYIIPVGSPNEKPVKIVMEGTTLVDDRKNYDWSKDIQVYKKFGVALRATNDITVYRDTEISQINEPSV